NTIFIYNTKKYLFLLDIYFSASNHIASILYFGSCHSERSPLDDLPRLSEPRQDWRRPLSLSFVGRSAFRKPSRRTDVCKEAVAASRPLTPMSAIERFMPDSEPAAPPQSAVQTV
ncbi:hypothetical protein, partial [Gluconacetobacter johannae]|uniref:hypothetical protein n=1 Tax=Gluconacetobacter johannae TaxID=112140 RepID=UPI00223106E5